MLRKILAAYKTLLEKEAVEEAKLKAYLVSVMAEKRFTFKPATVELESVKQLDALSMAIDVKVRLKASLY